ncbi:hypothetical protein H2200_005970 [Cladophialophora chaetospira]|uniref:Uncharacterized protein n=1 Tax=Cladophialophora chaetospira TaxID=386627 RepID=A0AA39CIX5_9EURO|nr:hypothetical protein H2200_005970 [Cladophialophora chaetospira]
MSISGLKKLGLRFLGLPKVDDTTTPDDMMNTLTGLAYICMETEMAKIIAEINSPTKQALIADTERVILDKFSEESNSYREIIAKVRVRVGELCTRMRELYPQCITATQEFDWATIRELREIRESYILAAGVVPGLKRALTETDLGRQETAALTTSGREESEQEESEQDEKLWTSKQCQSREAMVRLIPAFLSAFGE